jgi:hypothetical protein
MTNRRVKITINNAEPGTHCEWCDCGDERKVGGYPCNCRCSSEADFQICDVALDTTFRVCDYHQHDCLRFMRKARNGATMTSDVLRSPSTLTGEHDD